MPFTELGCAAGAMAIVAPRILSRRIPAGNVLIVSVDSFRHLPAQGYFRSELNLLDSLRRRRRCRYRHRQTEQRPENSFVGNLPFPNSLGAMGFDLRDSAFTFFFRKTFRK